MSAVRIQALAFFVALSALVTVGALEIGYRLAARDYRLDVLELRAAALELRAAGCYGMQPSPRALHGGPGELYGVVPNARRPGSIIQRMDEAWGRGTFTSRAHQMIIATHRRFFTLAKWVSTGGFRTGQRRFSWTWLGIGSTWMLDPSPPKLLADPDFVGIKADACRSQAKANRSAFDRRYL